MQDVDIYNEEDMGQDASSWYVWWSLYETRYMLLIYMMKLIWHTTQVVDIYDKAYLRPKASSWERW